MGTTRYTLKFIMSGIEEPFLYEVAEDEKERLLRLKDASIPKEEKNSFFCFESVDGKSVAISLNYLLFVNALEDYNIISEPKDEDIEYIVKMYFLSQAKVITADIDDAESAYMFMNSVELYPELNERYLYFIDIDGEEVIVNPEQLIVLELPTELCEEGRNIIVPETEDTD